MFPYHLEEANFKPDQLQNKETKPDLTALPTKFREGRFMIDENVAEYNKLRMSHVIGEFRAKDKESQRSVFQHQPCISKKQIKKERNMAEKAVERYVQSYIRQR